LCCRERRRRRRRKRRRRKRCVRGTGRAETPYKIETRGRAEQDERNGPDGRGDRDAVLGGNNDTLSFIIAVVYYYVVC
jgi:hypothetical protein